MTCCRTRTITSLSKLALAAWLGAGAVHADTLPLPAAGSCGQSKLLKPAAVGAAGANMLVRVRVREDGTVHAPAIDTGSGIEQVDRRALALIQACRFTPAQREGKPVAGDALIALAFASEQLEEPALRALYQRYLPSMRRTLEGRKQYHAAHILVKTEAAARAVLAKLAAGEPFAQVALDHGAKDDGELGWILSERYTPRFAAALRNRTAPGLLPEPVETEYGWHVIRIDAIRPAEPSPFESVREALWRAAVAEMDAN
ncbi:MAG: TonB family protein [Pseudomonadota bacterium]